VRVTTAFNRLLGLPGASVIDVSFSLDGVIVTVRLRRRRRVCSACGQIGRHLQVHDRRVKRWRHLDLGSTRCMIECELRLLRCTDCRVVRAEPVPWARPGAHHTRDFEDVVAWLAQQMAKTPRSTGCCGSAGTASGGSLSASSQTTSITVGWPARSPSALTRSPIAAPSASSPASSTTRRA
jgi:transposase